MSKTIIFIDFSIYLAQAVPASITSSPASVSVSELQQESWLLLLSARWFVYSNDHLNFSTEQEAQTWLVSQTQACAEVR